MPLIRWSRNIGTVRIADPVPLASLDQQDVDLFRFYAARTSFTLSGTRTLAIWQSSTPDEAKSHVFLMHSMLALTALHGCFTPTGGSVDYASIASRHHETALEAFRTSISEVKRENGRAVALFSLLTTIFSCGVPLVRGFPDGASPVSMFLGILGMLRTASSALGRERHNVEQGSLRPLLNPGCGSKPCELDQESRQLLTDLYIYIENCGDDMETKIAYCESITTLLNYFWGLPKASPLTDILGWPLTISDTFFNLMMKKKPLALIHLAFFFTPIHQTPSLWLRPWAEPIIREIYYSVDDSLRRFIVWPARTIGILPPISHEIGCFCFDCYMKEQTTEFTWREGATPLLAI